MNNDLRQLLPSEQAQLNEQLAAQVQAMANEMYVRSAPRVAELVNALLELTARANTGDQGAKGALGGFFKALDEARAASSGIEIPKLITRR